MAIEVRKVEPPDDEELLEQWTRSDPGELGDVEALLPDDHPWQVIVGMAEFVRVEPLESRMSDAVYAALLAVPGVTEVAREDTEVWLAWGAPAGADLVRAAAAAIDPLVPAVERLRVEQRRAPEVREARPRPGSPPSARPEPEPKGPQVASAVLAAIGLVLLVVGIVTGDGGSITIGLVALLFFGGGLAVLRFLRR